MIDVDQTVRLLRYGHQVNVRRNEWRRLAMALQPGSYGMQRRDSWVRVWLHPEFVIPEPPTGGYIRAGFFKRAVC